MPCYDDRNSASYQVAQSKEEWLHNSPVAELLCELMTTIESDYECSSLNNPSTPLSRFAPRGSKLWHWWEDHKERDAKKAREEARAKVQRASNRLVNIKQLEQQLRQLKKG